MEDISDGLEVRPIPCEPNNALTQEDRPFPASFRYVRRNIPGPGCSRDQFEEQLRGCDCRQGCHHDTCHCLKQFGSNYHPCTPQLSSDALTSSSLRPLFECNSQCTCHATCSNRLVQHGPRVKLKIAPTGARGFGLFACEDIRQLSFVCEYAGEVVSSVEALKRMERKDGGMNYLIVLREHCSMGVVMTCVDPEHVGNVGRFANHSCDPNLLMVPVRVDNTVPKLALFARRDISAGEELTFDYSGESVLNGSASETDSVKVQKRECNDIIVRHCGHRKEVGVKPDKCEPLTENDSEQSCRGGQRNRGCEICAGSRLISTNISETVNCETPVECSHCLNHVTLADKWDHNNGSALDNTDVTPLTNNRKRKQCHSERQNSDIVKRSCGKEVPARHPAGAASTNQTALKICLCGSDQCKGYLPFDRLILESS